MTYNSHISDTLPGRRYTPAEEQPTFPRIEIAPSIFWTVGAGALGVGAMMVWPALWPMISVALAMVAIVGVPRILGPRRQ